MGVSVAFPAAVPVGAAFPGLVFPGARGGYFLPGLADEAASRACSALQCGFEAAGVRVSRTGAARSGSRAPLFAAAGAGSAHVTVIAGKIILIRADIHARGRCTAARSCAAGCGMPAAARELAAYRGEIGNGEIEIKYSRAEWEVVVIFKIVEYRPGDEICHISGEQTDYNGKEHVGREVRHQVVARDAHQQHNDDRRKYPFFAARKAQRGHTGSCGGNVPGGEGKTVLRR